MRRPGSKQATHEQAFVECGQVSAGHRLDSMSVRLRAPGFLGMYALYTCRSATGSRHANWGGAAGRGGGLLDKGNAGLGNLAHAVIFPRIIPI